MTDKLTVYNMALQEMLGVRRLASLTEATETRRNLDAAWNAGFIERVLQKGHWEFATRTQRVTYNPSYTASFGYQYGVDLPGDYAIMIRISIDEYFVMKYENYQLDRGTVWCDDTTLYMRYVSTDSQYGGDLSLWSEAFTKYAAAELACSIVATTNRDKEAKMLLVADTKRLLLEAGGLDASAKPTQRSATGTWVASRGGSRGWRDGGNRNQLIG